MEIEIIQIYFEEVPFPSSKQLNTESSHYGKWTPLFQIFLSENRDLSER